jgi:hypothetical protein
MDFIRGLFNKGETSVKPLTKKDINDTVSDLITNDNPNPSNQEIAEKLGRPKVVLPPLFRTAKLPLNQTGKWDNLPKPPNTTGGRKIKNKKKHNKLSRRRRQPDIESQ